MSGAGENGAGGRLAFFHDGGLEGWAMAERFAGPGGRVATMPDIVDARIASGPRTSAWCRYQTTSSAEYYGISRAGSYVLAVLHGVGPMATLEGARAAYSWSLVDNEDRKKEGGRISREDFLAVLDGRWGEPHVVDVASYLRRYEYPFSSLIRGWAETDPLVAARMGGSERVARYLEMLDREDVEETGGQGRTGKPSPGHLLRISDDPNNSYTRIMDGTGGKRFTFAPRMLGGGTMDDGAMATLLSISQPCMTSGSGDRASLQVDIGTHEWWNGTRFVGWRAGAPPGDIPQDSSYDWASKARPDLLSAPYDGPVPPVWTLMKDDEGDWWVQRPKDGARMDTGVPLFRVSGIEEVGGPVPFETTASSYPGFFKYDVSEVVPLMPEGANAYAKEGEPGLTSDERHVRTSLRFYRVEFGRDVALRREKDMMRDPDAMMAVVEARLAA